MRTLLFTLILPAAISMAQETKPAAAALEPAKSEAETPGPTGSI